MATKQEKRIRRHKKIRMNMHGTASKPRLCVFRSNQHIYAQLIDDDKLKIIASVSDLSLKAKKASKSELSVEVGKLIAKKAGENKISQVVFDRGGTLYHGRVKALADAARQAGLKF